MSRSSGSPFVVGCNAVSVSRPRWGGSLTIRRVEISKVLKSGNFKLNGSDQQYRPERSMDGGWKAYPTGDRSYYSSIEIETDALRDEARQAADNVEFDNLFEKVASFKRKLPANAERIEALRAAIAILEKEP